MKILSIIGARPHFIKYASLGQELRKEHNEVIVHTGQHYDYEMSEAFFNELQIPEPDYNLGVGSGTHGYQIGEMVKRIEKALLQEKPDLVLVYGDTNSTLTGALATSKLHIKLGHVEAGCRSFDKTMPEEINRVVTDYCSDLLFCPTKTTVENLKRESITEGVYLTGDVMVDVLLHSRKIAENSQILDAVCVKSKHYLLATVHRASNTDSKENLGNIVSAFDGVNETIVFPIHPRTEKCLHEYGLYNQLIRNKRVKITKSLGYLDFLKLAGHAKKVLTDSGGVQKEAYILKVPCITLRANTEWVETVEDGWNILVGANKDKIIQAVEEFEPSRKQTETYGNGEAGRNIKDIISLSGFSFKV